MMRHQVLEPGEGERSLLAHLTISERPFVVFVYLCAKDAASQHRQAYQGSIARPPLNMISVVELWKAAVELEVDALRTGGDQGIAEMGS